MVPFDLDAKCRCHLVSVIELVVYFTLSLLQVLLEQTFNTQTFFVCLFMPEAHWSQKQERTIMALDLWIYTPPVWQILVKTWEVWASMDVGKALCWIWTVAASLLLNWRTCALLIILSSMKDSWTPPMVLLTVSMTGSRHDAGVELVRNNQLDNQPTQMAPAVEEKLLSKNPYICPYCGKSFFQDLTEHLPTHSHRGGAVRLHAVWGNASRKVEC